MKEAEKVPAFKRFVRPVGHDCKTSTTIYEALSFGTGELDRNGFWEYGCAECARAHEQQFPEQGECWPHPVENAIKQQPDSYAQWCTDCPSCGHDVLIVESVILCATGESHQPRSVLQADGFDVNCGDELKDQSTQDEVIKCEGCGKRFDLSELTLDGLQKRNDVFSIMKELLPKIAKQEGLVESAKPSLSAEERMQAVKEGYEACKSIVEKLYAVKGEADCKEDEDDGEREADAR